MKEQILSSLSDLEVYLRNENPDVDSVISFLRETPLPFIASYQDDLTIGDRFDLSYKFMHVLGQYNVALSVGLCMNQYITFSISCLPTHEGTAIHMLKNQFLTLIKNNKWILAVSSFDDFVRGKDELPSTVYCITQPDGAILCTGVKNFQSNITNADVLLFTGTLDNKETAIFYTFLKQAEGIEFGDSVFSGAMSDSDTRTVTFKDHKLAAFQMVPSGDEGESLGLHELTRVVFAVMAMAPYLGGAMRAIDEACAFLKSVHVEGESLASLDGYIVEMGRAEIKYEVCQAQIEWFANSINSLREDNFDEWLRIERPKVLATKHHVTSVCEELVKLSRLIIGTRSMVSSHIVSKLSEQILFGALHPVTNGIIERELGAARLKDK